MIPKIVASISLAILSLVPGVQVSALAEDGMLVRDTVETIPLERLPVPGTAGPVTQSYILIEVTKARAILVLFAGGGGKLELADGELATTSTNFLVRTRHLFAARGFDVVVPDAASDILTLPDGLRGLRRSEEHLSDVAAVIEDVRAKVAGGARLPVCLVGTSRGTISAAAYGATAETVIPGAPTIQCLVLTAPVTEPSSPPNESLDDVPLENVAVPTLLVTHRRDACFVTPPTGVHELEASLTMAPDVDVRIFFSGAAPLSDACGSLSPHGFFGIEPRVVKVIGRWIAHALENGA